MTMPADLKSEQLLLARMLNSINSVNDAIASLTDEDFLDPLHKVIFSAMQILYKKDFEIEPVSVCSVIKESFPEQTNFAYVFGLSKHQFGDAEEVKLFIENIKEYSRLRKLINIGINLSKEAASKEKNSEKLQHECLLNIESVFSDEHNKSSTPLADLLKSEYQESGMDFMQFVEQQMENRAKGINVLRGIPTGFNKIDDYLSGLSRGHFIIVGARPGVGKTTLILNFMLNLMKKNIVVGFFSLEMTKDEAMKRLNCIEAGLNYEKVERGNITSNEYMSLFEANKELQDRKRYNLFIDDSELLPVNQLVSRAKRMIVSNKVEVIFIDYLGEVRGNGKFASKQEEIQSVSKALRAMAKKMKVPVVCVCQLNRETEKENRAPRKSDLRESGQIEADAHSILLLHRPSQDSEFINPGLVKVFIVKNRFGKEGCVHLHFDAETSKFLEINYQAEPNE